MGTACYIKGANQILDSIQQAHGIKPGETTADGQVSVLTARCLGACGLAAAVVFDGEVAGKQDANGDPGTPAEVGEPMTPEELPNSLPRRRNDRPPSSTTFTCAWRRAASPPAATK